jgi:hypothetical protein
MRKDSTTMNDEEHAGPARRLRLLASVAATMIVGGCVSFSADGGLSTARAVAYTELNKDVVKVTNEANALATQQQAEALLRRPLTPDSAVQVALLKNRGLQAEFNDLGVSEAEYIQATLPPNPTVALSRLGGSLELEIERQILIGLFELATLPARAAVAEQRFRAAQFRTAEAVLRLAAETRREYYRAIAANQQVAFMQQALGTAETASELTKQLGESGAINKLEQAREHAFYQELGRPARPRPDRAEGRPRAPDPAAWAVGSGYRVPPAKHAPAPAEPYRFRPGRRAPCSGAAR